MTSNRNSFLLLLFVFLLAPSAVADDEDFRCVVCGQIVDKGYRIEGKFYCKPHVEEALPKCYSCGKPIKGQYMAVSEKRHPVCTDCRENQPRCFLCTMPAADLSGGRSLPDGRRVCRDHLETGVSDPGQAQQLFRQARSEVIQVLGNRMRLPKPVKSVKLVGLQELIASSKGSGHSSGLRAGKVLGITNLTYLKRGNESSLQPSTINLLNYVPAERMLSVAAHEYTHVWHAENHRDYSTTKSVLREGFAEWVAYKVAQSYGRTEQMEVMMNPNGVIYYQGLRKFLELERRRGIDGVLDYAVGATKI